MKKLIVFLVIFFSFGSVYGDEDGKITDQQRTERNEECDVSGNCIDRTSFTIDVGNISPGIKAQGENTTQRVNWLLGTIIQRMMLALGILSVLIMTVGAGYIILHNGQDEILSKGKTIFMSGVYSMIIALTSYYLIAIVRFLLFTSSN